MDTELLLALMFMWCSSTLALVVFLTLWFRNYGETFHPHSIEVDSRHPMFLVVGDKTRCKPSFVVKSISAFVAPRGSSSNKVFTSIIIVLSLSGMFGASRWYAIGVASFDEARLAFIGFGALLLTAAFETDVSNARFLEDKLMVTTWLIQKLKVDHLLPFSLDCNSLGYRQFLRQSNIYKYYEEEDRLYVEAGKHTIDHTFPYLPWWSALHTLGAVIYVCAVPTAVIWNEQYPGSHLVAFMTWVAFTIFCLGGYLTGTYLPVIMPLRCIILQWNPFYHSSTFLEELHEAVVEYSTKQIGNNDNFEGHTTHFESTVLDDNKSKNCEASLMSLSRLELKAKCRALGLSADGTKQHLRDRLKYSEHSNCARNRKKKKMSNETTRVNAPESHRSKDVINKASDILKDNLSLRLARKHPRKYLQLVGHLMVMHEMVAVLLPSIAVGISWITALCPDNPINSFLGLSQAVVSCFLTGSDSDCDFQNHCILLR